MSGEIGNGRPAVVCLHSSVSSGRQWQDLITLLEGQLAVTAVDLIGYGSAPEWDGGRPLRLDDEVDRLEDILTGGGVWGRGDVADDRVHLVGHSYGGAVAARAAQRFGEWVASLTLYEPVLFRVLHDDPFSRTAREEIEGVERQVRGSVEAGRLEEAAECFIDYWTGDGAWKNLSDWRRAGLAGKMKKVVSDFDAALGSDYDLAEFGALATPTFLMYGLGSPQSSRRVVERLASALPNVELRGLLGLGHMGPVTHPALVNPLIARYLHGVRERKEREAGNDQQVA